MHTKFLDDSYLSMFKPVEVTVNKKNKDPRDELEDAIRDFRGIVTKERIMSDLKTHSAYEKPSDKKRRKHREMLRRIKKISFGKYDEENE